jgi:hypothetical protein
MGITLAAIRTVGNEYIIECLLAMMTLDEVQTGLLGAFSGEKCG